MTKQTTLFEDGSEGRKPKLKEIKSFKKAKVELVDPDQVWRTKYKSEYCQELIEMANRGLSTRAFAAKIEVSYATVYRWAREISEFRDAMEIAEMKRHLFYEVTALANLKNREFNTQLFSRLAQTIGRWRDEDNLPAEHLPESNIDPSLMSAEDRRRRIRELTEQVKLG